METISTEELMQVTGGTAFGSAMSYAGLLGTYIMVLDYAESFGEGLGEGFYDGLKET